MPATTVQLKLTNSTKWSHSSSLKKPLYRNALCTKKRKDSWQVIKVMTPVIAFLGQKALPQLRYSFI